MPSPTGSAEASLTSFERTERELAALREALQTALGVDSARLGRIRMHTGGRASDAWSVTCPLDVEAATRVLIRLEPPAADAPALYTGPGFRLSHSMPHDGAELRRWATALRTRMSRGYDAPLADAISRARARLTDEDRASHRDAHEPRQTLGDEHELLQPLMRAYERRYGVPLRVKRTKDGSPALEFPPVVTEQSLFFFVPQTFITDVRFRAYLADLGYAVGRDRLLRTVPTPVTFRAGRVRLGIDAEGYSPKMLSTRTPTSSARAWIRQIARGYFPINLYDRLTYRATAPLRARPVLRVTAIRRLWNTHFHALGHDMSLHVFSMHRIPRSRMRELSRRAEAALSSPPTRRRRETLRFGWFVEGTLTRHCLEVWNRIGHPNDFAEELDASFEQLCAELD